VVKSFDFKELLMKERIQFRLQLLKPLLVPVILFIGFEVLTISWLSANPDSAWRLAVALLPMLPGAWLALGVVRAFNRLDELEQKNLYDGMVFGFVGTFILLVSLGFLNIAGLPQLDASVIALIMVVLALIGKLWSGRMYR
jgi:hypothetical protein